MKVEVEQTIFRMECEEGLYGVFVRRTEPHALKKNSIVCCHSGERRNPGGRAKRDGRRFLNSKPFQ
jgi:hypothetical protein